MICAFLTVTWGAYLIHSFREYIWPRKVPISRRGERIIAMRKIVVSICLFGIVFGFLVRSLSTYTAVLTDISPYFLFTATGMNIIGSVFVLGSLWFDD